MHRQALLMSFSPRLRFGRDREIEALKRRISTLQAALQTRGDVGHRWRHFSCEATAIAAVVLAVGFAFGVYREPIKELATAVVTAAALASPTSNADAAYAAYQEHDYATALQLGGPLAAAGDARAQSLLGLVYYGGHRVSRDYAEAARWFRRAADQGDVTAQFQLGLMFSQGQGVPQDHTEAMKLFRLAADQGDPQAQYNLGIAFAKGHAGEPDNVSAYMWFSLAAAHFRPSDTHLDTAITSRDLVARQMTRDQIAEAQERSRAWESR
jgi:hypothetical protein